MAQLNRQQTAYSHQRNDDKQLNEQDRQILQTVMQSLSYQGFHQMQPIRLSYSDGIYQGLIKAKNSLKNQVMIKWESVCKANMTVNPYQSLNYEMDILQKLHGSLSTSPSIPMIAILSTGITPTFCYYVMPLYTLGNINQFIENIKKAYTMTQVQQIKQALIEVTAQAMFQLHQVPLGMHQTCIHGDIKPSNILVKECRLVQEVWHIEVQFIDFALAQTINGQYLSQVQRNKEISTQGTPAYLAPECWQGQPKSIDSDYYALGVLIYEVLMDVRPFRLTQPQKSLSQSAQMQLWSECHQSQPVLKLSEPFTAYQPMINQYLSKHRPRQ